MKRRVRGNLGFATCKADTLLSRTYWRIENMPMEMKEESKQLATPPSLADV